MQRRFNEIIAITNRILIELIRMRRSLIFWVVFPTLMLLLFGLIYAGGNGVGSEEAPMVYPQAGLRPPLKPDMQFSRIRLSRERPHRRLDRRNQTDKI